MEEMNKEIMENGMTEIVEEVSDKLTFGQNAAAYGIAFVFGVGLATTAYAGYKGVKALAGKIRSKKKIVEETEEDNDVVDVEHEDIHEVKDDESEDK